MQKRIIISIIIILTILGIIIGLKIYQNKKEIKDNQKYQEIKENVRKAVVWNIKAQYPKCLIENNFQNDSEPTSGTSYGSTFLLNNGYIKKEELLDIDGKSYCDTYVRIKVKYENQLNHQENCRANYKIYLKCQNYKDKGYINWDK